jgi:hypothetical protein
MTAGGGFKETLGQIAAFREARESKKERLAVSVACSDDFILIVTLFLDEDIVYIGLVVRTDLCRRTDLIRLRCSCLSGIVLCVIAIAAKKVELLGQICWALGVFLLPAGVLIWTTVDVDLDGCIRNRSVLACVVYFTLVLFR